MSEKMTVGYVAQLTQPGSMAVPMGWPTALDATHTPALELERLRAEVLALRKDADLLSWILAHPETAAEELEDAAAGEGTARRCCRRSCWCRITLPITGLRQIAKRAVAIPVDWRVGPQCH